MILAVDTSSALTSVAVTQGREVLAEDAHLDARRHAEVLAPLLEGVLRRAGAGQAQVEAVVCGVGPGPYTGLRVGIATAIALGSAWRRPVYGLCSLDAIAAAVVSEGPATEFFVATDARRHEVYWARYAADGERRAGPLVNRPDELDSVTRALPWYGHGALAHGSAFAHALGAGNPALEYPQAGWLGRRAGALLATGAEAAAGGAYLAAHGGDGAATADALRGSVLLRPQPLYLRRPDATEPSLP